MQADFRVQRFLVILTLISAVLLVFPFKATFAQGPQVITLQRDVKPSSLTLGKGEFTVTLTLNANSAVCPVGAPKSSPLDIILILDHSGSMNDFLGTFLGSGSKMENAKKAAKQFVATVGLGTDQVGIVQFNEQAALVQSLTANRQDLEKAIDSIRAGGGTTIESGIEVAQKELDSSRHRKETERVVVLLTDGRNESSDDKNALAAAAKVKSAGIRLITIGLGTDVNETLLRQMAAQSSDYYFAPDARDLAKIYEAIAKVIKKPIAASNLTIRHSLDVSAFEIVPGSLSPSGSTSPGEVTWTLPSISDGMLTFTYRATPRTSGRFNIDAGDQITFTQCESTPGEITLPAGLPVVVGTPPPPPPTATPTRTPTPIPTFTPAPPLSVPLVQSSPLDSICMAADSLPLWVPCLLFPLIVFLYWFIRKFLKEWNRGPKKRYPCPLIWWLLLPLLLLLLWLVLSQILNNVCLGRQSLYFWKIESSGSSGIFVTNPSGTRPARAFTQVNQASQCVGCHAVSSASRRIALIQDGGVGPVAIFGLDGKLVPIPEIKGSFLSWSPDGNKLAISTENHIIVILDVNSGTITPLVGANDPNYSQIIPAWSPDGNTIAFVRSKGNGTYRLDEPADIYVVRATGGIAQPMPGASGSGFNYYPAYSPDGKWLAFTRHTAGRTTYSDPNAEIFIVPASGGAAKRLAANDASDGRKLSGVGNSWPAWSLDGTTLAFNSKRNGKQFDIFTTQISPDGTSGPAVQLNSAADPTAFEHLPFWGEPPQVDPIAGVLDLWPWLLLFLFVPLLYWLCRWLHPRVPPPPPPGREERKKPKELPPLFLQNTWQVVPTLIIGYGGTGRWVLTLLKKNLKDSGMGILPDQVRLLLLDTSEREEANVFHDAAGKQLNVEVAGEALDASEILLLRGNLEPLVRSVAEKAAGTEAYRGWFPASYYREVGGNQLYLANGTQGRRPLARAGLVKGLLDEDPNAQSGFLLWKTLTTACREVLDQNQVRVIIVGSIAGGMSGTLFDLAQLARQAGKKVIPQEGTVTVETYLAGTGAFAYAGGNANQRLVNSFATARELQRFQLSKGLPYTIRHRATGTAPLDTHCDIQLFDDVFLFGEGGQPESTEGKSTEPWATIFASMADVITFRIDRGIKAGTNLDYRGDAQRQLTVLQNQKNIAFLGSAGSFAYRLPLRDIVEQIRVRWARQLLREFLQGSSTTDSSTVDSHQIKDTRVPAFLSGQLSGVERPAGMSVIEKLSSGLTMHFSRAEMDNVPDPDNIARRFQDYLKSALGIILNGEKGQTARADRIDQANLFLQALSAQLIEAGKAADDTIQISKEPIASGLERTKKLTEAWRVHVDKVRQGLQLQHDLLKGRPKTAKQSELIGAEQILGSKETTVKGFRRQMDQIGVREYLWWRAKDSNKALTDKHNQIDLAEEWYDQKADPHIAEFLPRFYWEFTSTGEPHLGLISFEGSHITLDENSIDKFVNELLKMGSYVVQDIWTEIKLPEIMRGRHVVGGDKYAVETATRMWGAATPHLQAQSRDQKAGAVLGAADSLRHAASEYVRVFEELGGMEQKIPSSMSPSHTVIAELTDQYATGLIRTLDFVPISEISEMKRARSRYEQSLIEQITGVEGAELQTAFAAERYALDYEKRLSNSGIYRLPMRQLHPVILIALERVECVKLYALTFAAKMIEIDPNKTTATLRVPGQSPQVLARKSEKQLDLRIAGLFHFCQGLDQKVLNAVQYIIDNPSDEVVEQWREYYSLWKNWSGQVPMAKEPQEVQDLGAIAALEVFERLETLRDR